jgi:hypothetical protein
VGVKKINSKSSKIGKRGKSKENNFIAFKISQLTEAGRGKSIEVKLEFQIKKITSHSISKIYTRSIFIT